MSIYKKVPRLCVDLVVKTNKGVVLSKRAIPPQIGKWHLPGGTVLFGEKLEEAVQRVAIEELNTKVEIVKAVGPIEYSLQTDEGRHTVSMGYLVKPLSAGLRGGKQGKEIKFFKKLSTNTIKEQAEFLKKNDLMN